MLAIMWCLKHVKIQIANTENYHDASLFIPSIKGANSTEYLQAVLQSSSRRSLDLSQPYRLVDVNSRLCSTVTIRLSVLLVKRINNVHVMAPDGYL